MKRRLASFLLACSLAACNPQPTQTAAAPSPSPSTQVPPLHITGEGTARQPVRIVQQRGNRKQYELVARSYESNGAQGSARAIFRNVHVTFFGKDGSRLAADAPEGVIDEAADTVTLRGGVRARSSSGVTLTCRELVYSRKSETIHGSGGVVVVDDEGLRATGATIDSDISLTRTRMQ